MALAIFDLDNTLLADDSDYLWGRFLVEQGIVDGDYYEQENDRFYREYKEGQLDIYEFLHFSLKPLADHPLGRLLSWRRRFLEEKIEPNILPAGQALVSRHRDAGDTLLIVTATNAFVTAPIAERLGVPHLIATEPELVDNRYTGRVVGVPSFREGKIARLEQWLSGHGLDLTGSHFYSDSHNDIPLLGLVDHPVAVDPDESLAAHAHRRDWPIISLRNGAQPCPHPGPHR